MGALLWYAGVGIFVWFCHRVNDYEETDTDNVDNEFETLRKTTLSEKEKRMRRIRKEREGKIYEVRND